MRRSTKAYGLSVALLAITFLSIMLIASRSQPAVTRTNLERIPMQIGAYQAVENRFPESIYDELNADVHLYRHYRHPDGTQISLYIGYYGTAKGGRTGHNPYACLPGAGWGIITTSKVSLQYGKRKATVNAIVAKKKDSYETLLHWYQSDKDKILATGVQQNIQRFLNRIKHNRNDGAYIQLSTRSQQKELNSAQETLKTFAQKILPQIQTNWPEEKTND